MSASPALAQAPAPTSATGEELPRIRITDPGRDLLKLALPNVIGDGGLAAEVQDVERRALDIVGLFNVLNPAAFPPDLQREGLGFSSALWSQVGAQGVAKAQVTRAGSDVVLEGRLYQVGRGEAPVMQKSYRGPGVRALAHSWVNDIINQFTGTPGIFGSRIAFAHTGKSSEIGSVSADGGEAKTLTKMGSDSLMPAYSPDGGRIAFTSYLRGTADLWIVPSQGGRAKVLSRKPGMNSGAVWTRDGQIILTMSYEGNAELYRISSENGQVLTRLTRNPFIDMSASLSPDGGQIAFVSDRGGSAQVYVMPASGGGTPRRLTFQGNNNTTPRWRPRADKQQIAFTGRDERGAFDVFIYDMQTQRIDRVTQNQGSNQSPDWSPDGRLLVYSSSRGGLFVTNPETRKETQLFKGRVNSPSWGPAPRR